MSSFKTVNSNCLTNNADKDMSNSEECLPIRGISFCFIFSNFSIVFLVSLGISSIFSSSLLLFFIYFFIIFSFLSLLQIVLSFEINLSFSVEKYISPDK